MKKSKVRLKDISQATGFSLLSVHRAVNNKEGISDQTRKKILKTVKEMGYEVNYSAASLKRKKLVFGLISIQPRMKGDYYDKIQEGAQKAIREKSGLNCAFKSYFFSRGPFAEEKEREIIDKIILSQGKGLDGIVIIPISSSSVIRGAINKIISLGIPVVTIDNNFEEVQTLCSVAPDSSAIGEIAAEFLDTIHLPKGKILLACGSKDSANHQKDAQGFLSYLAFRKEMYEIDIIEDGKSKEDFYQRCKQYLSENDDLVAYYTVRERNTIPFCQAVIDASKQGALVIIGSDLLPAHIEMLKQGILTVILHKNPFQRGYLAMKVLSDFLIKKVNPEDKELTVPINLVLKSNVQFFKDE